MRAVAVTPSRRELGLVEHPEPSLDGPSDVKLRMLEVGVCGTDKEIVTFEYGTPPAGSDYLVLGHESLGEVVETAAQVEGLAPGDLVVTMVRRPCGEAWCEPCRQGRQDFCVSGNYSERGIKERHGFMTELVVDEQRYMNAVPAELRDVAVLVEPLTIAEKAIEELWLIQQRLPWVKRDAPPEARGEGHRAVVLGAGPVGLLGAMALKLRGFDTYVYSRSSPPHDKSDITDAIGATYIAAEDHTVEEMAEQVGPIDVVYEAVGASALAFEVMGVLGVNGIFVFTGVPGRKAPVPVDTDRLMRSLVLNNQVALGSVNAGKGAFQQAIADLTQFGERWSGATHGLITGRFAMEDHRDLLLGSPGGIKNVIEIAR